MVTYTYDEWGKILSVTGTLANTVGQMNPIRYRGYYYDVETGLYYLQSRYYDPETGRFINADGQISGVGGDILGYNMFAYCMNNPVNMSDPSGHWPKWATCRCCSSGQCRNRRRSIDYDRSFMQLGLYMPFVTVQVTLVLISSAELWRIGTMQVFHRYGRQRVKSVVVKWDGGN